MPTILAKPWSDLELGSPQTHLGTCIVPILNRNAGARRYLTTSEAQARGGLRISEISSAGSVPSLQATNALQQGILIVDGEEFIGAKQNRVANLSVLLPAGASAILPVSCVEAGRWDAEPSVMGTSGHLEALPIRRERIDSVTRSARQSAEFQSDQHAVWAIIAVNGRWTTIELFCHPDLYAAHAGKVIRSSATALLSEPALATPRPPAADAESTLQEVAGSHVETYAAVGLGSTLRLESDRWHGSALSDGEAIVHLVAYAV